MKRRGGDGMIGKLERVDLRDVWKHEAQDFTVWLQENIDVLGDVIGMKLSNAEREQNAGSFNVDIIAEDLNGDTVVIENQLEKSDHDHLGKLVTYLTAFDAQTAVWLSPDPRPEHIKAVAWLNESSAVSFYFLKLEAIRIEDSPPAPLLTLIVGPSEEGRKIGKKKKELAGRFDRRYQFWSALLDVSNKRGAKLFANISPGKDNWISTTAGKSGISYMYSCYQKESSVFLAIDRGKDRDEENVEILHKLIEHKDEIQTAFGDELVWDEKDERRVQYVYTTFEGVGWLEEHEPQWPDLHSKMIDAMERLEKAMKPHIKKLEI
jgi:hypothetical protein